ncbi:MAG: CDP-alcohol phosphatidyltransferase family protein [Bacteroides sp.]|nr:CDP-alcohol phosphatidyltransferase family protein [Bacteroides sp.]MCM1550154.1 CDP-alcohol phosphatidyltransferase family protein [Clostridium sp.]
MDNSNMDSPYKNKIITIPNILSVFRILLLPLFVTLYLQAETNWEFLRSTIVLAVSALTDLADGKIARKFNMISELGKVLDPIADKLTHITIAFCLCWRFPQMIYVLILLVIKELSMMIMALYGTFRKNKKIWDSAQWYGKVCTTIVFVVFIALVLFPTMPTTIANILMIICAVGLAGSLILYIHMFWQLNSKRYREKHPGQEQEPNERK